MSKIEFETDLLASLIEQKRDVLTRLLSLIQRQSGNIEQQDYGQLLGVLAAKQPLLNELQSIEKSIDPFRAQDADARVWRSPQDRLTCRDHADQCQQLFQQVMAEEQRCEKILVEQRNDTEKMLESTAQAAQTHRAYQTNQVPTSSQLDLMSQG